MAILHADSWSLRTCCLVAVLPPYHLPPLLSCHLAHLPCRFWTHRCSTYMLHLQKSKDVRNFKECGMKMGYGFGVDHTQVQIQTISRTHYVLIYDFNHCSFEK